MKFEHHDIFRRLLLRVGRGLALGAGVGLFVGIIAAVVTSGGTDNVLRSDVGWRAGLVAFAIAFLFTIFLPSHDANDDDADPDSGSQVPGGAALRGPSRDELSQRLRGEEPLGRLKADDPMIEPPRFGQRIDPQP
ncbi:hypothetical protein [Arthrobacter sp. CAN_C5]|uniref:hypothetical protein n=1 Tax=Arthrobacter sp. CAN_C5 TaxID=2760706 RepID=UPI001AEB4EDD|nr:hypothetical protein [Arthrobacter sp. CAN_C5]MBP2217381.1 hypothetical protein [Arthrobacter sp. CAN_C5]